MGDLTVRNGTALRAARETLAELKSTREAEKKGTGLIRPAFYR